MARIAILLRRRRPELEAITLQHRAQFGQVFNDQIRFGSPQLGQCVVTGQHGAGMDAAVLGGGDVVFHVADEQCFAGLQFVVAKYLVDFFALVPDIGVRFFEKKVEAVALTLDAKMVGVDGAQEKRADLVRTAKFEERACVRQFNNFRKNFARSSC